jgi:sialate O-acetylesterase
VDQQKEKGEMESEQVGAIIEEGPLDWQILQMGEGGFGKFSLNGRWVGDAPGRVEVRLVEEATGLPLSKELDWFAADTFPNGTWAVEMEKIPAGGLYRLETRYHPQAILTGEWSSRGDFRHFIGVGDLWVITGQSNSAGYGRGVVYDPPEMGLHLFRNNEQWMVASHPLNESTDTHHVANREGANPGHSPYINFGRILKQKLNYPIGLVQASLGGSALSPWNPTESAPAVLYENMMDIIKKAGGKIKGILWYQGESDAGGEKEASNYEQRFINMVEVWRKALGDAELPVITVQLNRYFPQVDGVSELGWSMVREAQRTVPMRIKKVAVVPAMDLPLSDQIHTSPAGNMMLGDRMAKAALGMCYSMNIEYLAPDIEKATRSKNGSAIVLNFKNVTSRMDNIQTGAVPFKVEDEQGSVPVEHVGYHGGAKINLTLGRSLVGKAYVHGCPGTNPPNAPVDMERMVPMLAFYRMMVED